MKPGAEEAILLMMISGVGQTALETACLTKLEVETAEIKRVLKACRKKIVLAADYERDEELGRAISRLNDCYAKSAAIQDVKTCVAAQRELNKLMDLYHTPPKDPGAASADPQRSEDIDQARAHLAPLFDAGDTLPLHELARLAAQRILSA